MDSFTAKSISSTLHGATIQTAEGNEFINTGRDTIKLIQVIQNFIGAPESEQTSGGNIVEDNEDLQRVSVAPESEQTSGRNIVEYNQDLPVSDPVGNFDIYSAISTVLATIFGRRQIQPPLVVGDPTCPDESNLLPQEAITDRALIHCLEPAATVSDILAPDDFPFSSLPNTDTGRYTRSMLNCQRTAGYPLYEPRPDCDPSTEYWKRGVGIGDVGIVTEDGIFDFIFNVCPSQNPFINPSELPDDFEALEHPEIRAMEQHFKMETHLFNNAVNRIEEPDVRYKCSGPEGAILELPSGATLFEAKNKRSFRALASRHAENWYKYTIVTRGRDVPNGSLYLVTSCVKCTDWGIAVFDRPSASQDYLQFIEREFQTTNRNLHSKYDWKGSGSFAAKVAMDSDIPDSRDGNGPNQCIFVRGYKIMLRKDVWNNAIDPHSTVTRCITTPSSPNPGSKQTRQGDFSNQNGHLHREDGGGSESAGGTSRRPARNTYECGIKAVYVGTLLTTSSQLGAERVIIQADFNASPLNPSDLVNAALLSQEPNAKVALTHDDDWWDLLRDYGDLGKIASSYTSVIDEYGSASLETVGDALAFANKQGISSMQQQSHDQQHLQPPNHNPSTDMFSSPAMQDDAVRRPSPSHPLMPSQHMQNGMMTSAAQQNNTHTQPVPQTSMPFSSRPLQEQAMYLRNMIQSLNNNIAAYRASPPDVDPMTKTRVAVTYMSKRDAAAKMLNNVLAQMQAQSGGGQGQMPWMQQRQQQQGPSQPSFDAVSMPRNGLGIQSSQPQVQHQPGNPNPLVHPTQGGQVGGQSPLTLQPNSSSVQGNTANVLDPRIRNGQLLNMMVSMADQPVPQLKAKGLSEPIIQFIETHRSHLQRLRRERESSHDATKPTVGEQTAQGQANGVPHINQMAGLRPPPFPQPGPQNNISQPGGHSVETRQQLTHQLPPQANPIRPGKEQVQHALALVTKARQETMNHIHNRPLVNIPAEHRFEYNTLIEQLFRQATDMNNKLAMLYIYTRREEFVRRLIVLVVSVQHQRNLLSSPNPRFFLSLDNLRVIHQQMQQAKETCSQLFAALSQQRLQMKQQQQQQQIQSGPRPLNARNSFLSDTSQIRPPGASNPPLASPSLQPPQQQPSPPYRPFNARSSFPSDTSQIRPSGESNPPLASPSLQPPQQQPSPPYRPFNARSSFPSDTSQIRPSGASNPPLASPSLQPPQQQPSPPYRPFNARNSFLSNTSQIRPPGVSNLPLASPSLQPPQQQPTPLLIARNSFPLDTSQIRPPGASNPPLASPSLQPPQQQPTPPYRPLIARNSLPLDTSQIRPPGTSNPSLPSPSLQPPHPHPTPTPSPVLTSGHTPGPASAPSSSTPLNTNPPTPALPPSSLSPPSPRSPKGKISAKAKQAPAPTPKRRPSPPPVPAESPAATAASSGTPNAKRPRGEDYAVVDANSIRNNASAANEPSPPKRVKTDWEIPQTGELKKKAAEVKVESVEDTNVFFEQMSELLKKSADNEKQESAWYADLFETINTILKERSDNGLFGEAVTGRESSPSTGLKDTFDEFIEYSFGQPDGQLNHEEGCKAHTPDLVSSSSTNLSPESNTNGENSLSTMSSLSDVRKDDAHMTEVDGGESVNYQFFEWK